MGDIITTEIEEIKKPPYPKKKNKKQYLTHLDNLDTGWNGQFPRHIPNTNVKSGSDKRYKQSHNT